MLRVMPWPAYPNWPCDDDYEFVRQRRPASEWYQHIEHRSHRSEDGSLLLHYDVAVPRYQYLPIHNRRLFFTHFYWGDDGKGSRCITRDELIGAYCRLLDTQDVLFNLRCDIDMVCKEACALAPERRAELEAHKAVVLGDLMDPDSRGVLYVCNCVEKAASKSNTPLRSLPGATCEAH